MNVMKWAHELSRLAAEKHGGKPSEYFARSLKRAFEVKAENGQLRQEAAAFDARWRHYEPKTAGALARDLEYGRVYAGLGAMRLNWLAYATRRVGQEMRPGDWQFPR